MGYSSATIHNLPVQLTPFVGRQEILEDVRTLLADPDCRLLTLVGPGGIGKTRIAIEIGGKLGHFIDGVHFVPLQPLTSSENIASAIALAINYQFSGDRTAKDQLLNYLYEKHLLLILDNFEHLLDGSDLVIDLIGSTQDVKVLVTSREILNVQGEWVYQIDGMSYPDSLASSTIDTYDAVQLFIACARRVRVDFSSDGELPHITRICQLVDGMPLAIELAVSWLRLLSCKEIAAEIGQNIEFLKTSQRNVPQRHRNIHAVFEQSWLLLNSEEQEAFKRISIFPGGFRREAAEQVTDTSLQILSGLVYKSMLRVLRSGRYEIHELLRQYAKERLTENSLEALHIRNSHGSYYAEFLHRLEADLKGADQIAALLAIEEEIDNVRLSWQWMVEQKKEEEIAKSLQSLALFYDIRCWYQEADQVFDMAIRRFEGEHSVILGRLLVEQGHNCFHLNDNNRGKTLLHKGVSILRELGTTGEITVPLGTIPFLDDSEKERDQTIQFCKASLAHFTETGNEWGIAFSHIGLATLTILQKAYEIARAHAEKSLAIFRKIGNPLGISASLFCVATLTMEEESYESTVPHLQEIVALSKRTGDRGGESLALNFLSIVAYRIGDYRRSASYAQEALAIDRLGSISLNSQLALLLLSEISLAVRAYDQSRAYLCHALQLALESTDLSNVAGALFSVARLLAAENEKERAVEIFSMASGQYSEPFSQIWIPWIDSKIALMELEAELPPDVFVAAKQRGQGRDLQMVALGLLDELSATKSKLDVPATAIRTDSAHLDQPPIEPLSERELQVLQLIADGLTNKEIAHKLYISAGTVKVHTRSIYGKLNVNNRTQAATQAKVLGLL